tara:strand:+ start:108 stop:278 length:171 start_codon:yes stop_codon:yes gene_type:complete
MIKHIDAGLFLDTETGNMKYSSVVAACINYDLKQRYKTYYTTTVGLSGIQWGADLD